MNTALVKYEKAWSLRNQYHVLTYTEAGFSAALYAYARARFALGSPCCK